MGLFGFGRKKKKQQDDERLAEAVDSRTEDVAVEDSEDDEQTEVLEGARTEVGVDYEGRGETVGPWDVDDANAPDYDEYLSLGAYYLPFVQGIQLRIKANTATHEIVGATMTIGNSSLEVEAFAAPKTMGLWDDVREDLLASNPEAEAVDGSFGTEGKLPGKLPNGKTAHTRIVGVDGPRWMLRGIFSGKAASDPDGTETKILNDAFAQIVVERGDEPLSPRDPIPMARPLTPNERRALAAQEEDGDLAGDDHSKIPGRPDGPLSTDQQVEQQTTLRRGPMFSEVR